MSSPLPTQSSGVPSLVRVRPMLMLTGFLGAGKTTLLRAVLDELSSRSFLCDVILNDKANAEIDKESLRDHTESISALTASCVCCEGMDELYDTVLKLTQSKNKALLVELNGTADPLPLQEGFTLLEKKFLLHPRWQVCVVDARHFGQRSQFRDLENLQLETASHYYLSHVSELDEAEVRELELQVKSVNAHASRATAMTLANYLDQAVSKGAENRGEPLTSPTKIWAGKDMAVTGAAKLHDRHHFAHEFTGCNIVIPEEVEEEQVLEWLSQLPASVIRAKALVTLSRETDIRYLYERVGLKISPRPLPVRSVSQAPCSAIFVGAELDPEAILQQTKLILHPDCYLTN